MALNRKKQYLRKLFQLKVERQLYQFAINRYNLKKNDRMVRRYTNRIENVDFELEKLVKENEKIAFKINYEKESENYAMTELSTRRATLKFLGKEMGINELVKWSIGED